MNPVRKLFDSIFARTTGEATRQKENRKNGKRGPRDPAAAKREMAKLDQFATRVRDLLQTDEHQVVGAFQFLTLAKTRDHFGKDWSRVAQKIFLVVDKIIEARLGPLDCYARIGETTYVVVFARMEKQAAAMKAALIANEISRKLFGEDTSSFIQVGVAELDTEEATELSALAPAAMIKALAAKASAPINIAPAPEKPDAVASFSPGTARAAPSQGKGGGQPDEPDTIQADVSEQDDEKKPGSETEFDWRFDDVEVEAAPEWKHIRETYEIPPDLFFAYMPAWLVRREMIAAHSCVPARIAQSGTVLTGADAIASRRRAADNFGLDFLGLMKARRDIERSLGTGTPAVIVLPVHFETISTPRFRNSYVSHAARLTKEMRRQLIIEITGMAGDIPPFTFAKIADTLRPFCRDMLVRVQLETRSFAFLQNVGIHSVGVDLGERPNSETQVFPFMESFNERAKKAGISTFVHGLKTRSSVSGAVAAGFRYLDGPIIAPPIEIPERSRPWNAKDVYISLISELASTK